MDLQGDLGLLVELVDCIEAQLHEVNKIITDLARRRPLVGPLVGRARPAGVGRVQCPKNEFFRIDCFVNNFDSPEVSFLLDGSD